MGEVDEVKCPACFAVKPCTASACEHPESSSSHGPATDAFLRTAFVARYGVSPEEFSSRVPREEGEAVALPRAVYEGEIMGIRVAVLDDGTRVINAEDLTLLFERVDDEDFDPVVFAQQLRDFGDKR